MTAIETVRTKITAAKFRPDRDSTEYPFQRGWNAALEFVEQAMKEMEGASNDGDGTQQQRAVEGDHGADQ